MGTKKSAKAKYNRPIGGRGPKSPGPISAGGPKFSRPVGAKANFKIQKNTAQKGATSTSFGTNFGGRGATIPRSEESNSGEDDEKSAENVDEEDPIFEYESESLLTPNSSENEKERYEFPQFNDAAGFGEVYFELGMEFVTIESFKTALKDHVIYEGRKIRYIKNDQRRVRCDCEHGLERIKKPRKAKGTNEASTNNNAEPKSNDANNVQRGDGNDVGTMEGGSVNEEAANVTVETNSVKVVTAKAAGAVKLNPCPWLIYCAWNNQLKSYQIKTYISQHTCAREFGSNMADHKWVANKLEKRLRTQPHITLSEAYEHIKVDYNVIINGKMVYRALKEAREWVIGNERAQYSKLRDYLCEIDRSNQGSSAILDVTPMPHSLPLFNKLYISLGACKMGFKARCRKLIGLDGCFLKGYFGGQLLSAIG
ncbi:hypothetical protein AHAS_Ahas01G0177200 [Arachis hypogaea]